MKEVWRPAAVLGVVLALLQPAPTVAAAEDRIVIAHRGASGYLPEHTLEAYALAFGQGADYVEPDLVLTRDGVFICLHDIHLEMTTNVAAVFAGRKREDGRWYAADFTLAEIKRLAVHERLPKRFPVGRARFEVPTFEEMIELIQGLNVTAGREVGIYPELKAPAWHRAEGLPMEAQLLGVLKRYGYTGKNAKVFVQCFEAESLRMMRGELKSELPQVMLIGGGKAYDAMASEAGLDDIASFAIAIGPDKNRIEKNPALVGWAHARGLAVHPYTMRADDVPAAYSSFEDELRQFYVNYGVDGLFTDFPDRVREWLALNAAGVSRGAR